MSQRGKVTVLMFFFAVCGTAALVNYYWELKAERVKPVELYSIIYNQISAFHDDDFSRAYQQASSSVQQRFNIAQFADAIRADCAGIVNAERVEFGFIEAHGRHATIQVFLIDSDGQVTPCIYTLVSEGETWKIDSARVQRRWPAGARLGGLRS